MHKTALVVVDLQEDFLPPAGSLAVESGRTIVPGIVDMLNLSKFPWDLVVTTLDWHPQDHVSFASQHNKAPFSEIDLPHPEGIQDESGNVRRETFTLWPDHCIQDTPGAMLEPRFEAAFSALEGKVPTLVTKKGYLRDREFYSCVKDTWHSHHTGLDSQLKSAGITSVVLVGLAYDFCVFHSACDLALSGFDTYVVRDLTKPVYPSANEATEELYKKGGVKVVSSVLELPVDLFRS